MIFYFTGTGNSLAAAQTIARDGRPARRHRRAYKYKDFDFTLAQGEQLGFVFPVYNYTTPPIIDGSSSEPASARATRKPSRPTIVRRDQLRRVRGQHGARLRQAPVGRAGHQPRRLVQREIGGQLHIPVRARPRRSASACLPARNLPRARRQMHRSPRARTRRAPQSLGIVLSKFTEKDEKPRSTSVLRAAHLHQLRPVRRPLPTNTITIIEGAPRWAELGCTQCLACLHRCPVNAIQYGAKTERRAATSTPSSRKLPSAHNAPP
ncbi:MAG: 4Fe-4S ferredoxin [Adlercreutzia sp.]